MLPFAAHKKGMGGGGLPASGQQRSDQSQARTGDVNTRKPMTSRRKREFNRLGI